MEITLKELNGTKIALLSDYSIPSVEGVRGLKVTYYSNTRKDITIQLGVYNYFFARELKAALIRKIREDLGKHYNVKFGI